MSRLAWPDPTGLAGLSPHQIDCLQQALTAPVACLIGTPGTGKTYVAATLAQEIMRLYGRSSLAVAAPTGKAAMRFTSAARAQGVEIQAGTIHSLLEPDFAAMDGDAWAFNRCSSNPLDQKFLIVDEASMLDTDLMASLLDAAGHNTHLLLVGDPNQLPPVGHGAPLRDLLASRAVPRGELLEVQRNAGLIATNCAAIRRGEELQQSSIADFAKDRLVNHVHVDGKNESEVVKKAVEMALELRDGNLMPPVITATNKMKRHLNRELQAHATPENAPAVGKFRLGDRVICTRNRRIAPPLGGQDGRPSGAPSLYVCNGEIGEIVDFRGKYAVVQFTEPDRAAEFFVAPKAQQEEENEEDEGRLDLDLAYAITCHKAQGSEWPVVIVTIEPASYTTKTICTREWIYTAISRAKKLCITIGSWGNLEVMARNAGTSRRKTFLRELLDGDLGASYSPVHRGNRQP